MKEKRDMWVPLKEKEKKNKIRKQGRTDGVREERGESFIIIFSLLVSFLDLRKSDSRISSGK